ncbi:preprotein translocase subunit SecE [Burkholderia pseudomallei]|uniref:preprotein translocase subunit SecE n=1 Tax=Burkholderia pseudomallei TaxID=28450 RepID=UPI0004F798FB|nr:preprotein translocase subunit SecE [Burkholderia pseudomallei]AIP70794.1 preprotein translocase, SecE subunit [Burkholderia pseudomallei]AIV62376.1 preprotein translocase, SecE subunit [Burkholderia pseudomallei K42]AIV90731.1 preprotein translocase, SecE subunit [Burkholderia pseudomallei B03]AIV96167.1 preprotein translocase, SecE subunit [Burkholderia pseudomallei A79A]AJW92640.1 preprotein translocase, SecE subunit [Burkholderia pseudomallei 406e]
MANPSVETVNTSGDKLMLALGVLLVLAGFVGFFLLGGKEWYVRGAALAVGVIAGVGVALMSLPGKSFIAFAKDSYREVRKVVWPTRKEATQTTLVVFGFVLVMALFLWISDKSIEWAIFSVILGWK